MWQAIKAWFYGWDADDLLNAARKLTVYPYQPISALSARERRAIQATRRANIQTYWQLLLLCRLERELLTAPERRAALNADAAARQKLKQEALAARSRPTTIDEMIWSDS